MDKLVARKPLDFSLLSTLPERDLTAVRQVVNNLDSFVVVQELELAMDLALYGLLL